MTDHKPPGPPPIPPRIPTQRPERRPDPRPPAQPAPPSFDALRPGLDRPYDPASDRQRTVGRGAPPTRDPQTRDPQTQPPRLSAAPPPQRRDTPPMGRTSRSAPPPRSNWLFGALAAVMGLVALVGAGAAYLVYAPPVDLLRQQLVAQVKAKTGRDLTIAGPTKFSVFPALALSMSDVTLSAPVTMGGAPLVHIDKLEARVKLWPLLQRAIHVDQLILKRPVFELQVDAQGRRNWDFAELSPAAPVRYAQAAAKPAAPGQLPDAVKDFMENASDPDNPSPQLKARLARLEEIALGDVRIEQGAVSYKDARSGLNQEITNLDATVGLKSLASPLDAKGNLTYEGQALAFEMKLASLKAVVEDRPAKLTLSIVGAPIDLRYDGTVTARASVDVDGDVALKAESLRALALWLGRNMPPADGFGQMSLAGKLKTADRVYALNGANLGLDGATATGNITLDVTAARPRVNANLKISALDLNRYTLASGTNVPTKAKAVGKGTAPGAPAAGAKSIEDLINGAATAGPQVKGFTQRPGWSGDPIQLGALGLLDADAKISVGQLTYRNIKVGQSALTIALKSKVLRTNFDDVSLYSGRGRGFLSIDANAPTAVVGANFAIEGVAARDLLKDVADFDLLAGTGKLTLAIGAQGESEAQLVQTANGKADFQFTNGSIVGYNIPGVMRGLSKGQFSGLNKIAAEKTDFSELAASFVIANGIATNQDMRLNGPLLRVTGAGQIQLPAQAVDYTVKPKLVANLQGQGGTDALAGLEVPLRIHGPWASPQVTPDIGGILKDPGKAVEAIKEIGKQFKEGGNAKDIGDAVKGAIGKDGGKKLLEGLFR